MSALQHSVAFGIVCRVTCRLASKKLTVIGLWDEQMTMVHIDQHFI